MGTQIIGESPPIYADCVSYAPQKQPFEDARYLSECRQIWRLCLAAGSRFAAYAETMVENLHSVVRIHLIYEAGQPSTEPGNEILEFFANCFKN